MRLITLTIINIKRTIKNPAMLLMTFLFPMVVLFGVVGTGAEGSSLGKIGIIDNTSGKYSKNLIQELEEKYDIENLEGTVEDSYNDLRDKKLAMVYVLNEDFDKNIDLGKTPKIENYVVETGMGSIIAEDIINNYVNNLLEESINSGLSTNSIDSVIVESYEKDSNDYYMAVIMICYFMMIGATIITEDILKLKAQKVLKRVISTGNKDRQILGSLYISSFIIQAVISSLSLIVAIMMFKIERFNLGLGILAITLCSLITTAIIMTVTRWVKNQTLASLAVVIFGLLAFAVGILGTNLDEFSNVPKAIGYLSVISPFSWLGKIINGESIFISIIVIVLMSLAFFTLGSFKLRDYVKE
ncbi:MAG: ABC transporter permease [Clostridium sp.]|nr:ABC transporter permease [Clostridium sp.]